MKFTACYKPIVIRHAVTKSKNLSNLPSKIFSTLNLLHGALAETGGSTREGDFVCRQAARDQDDGVPR